MNEADAEDGAVANDDYAIVVGITRYPEYTRDGKSADLKGSFNDATSIHEWLISGGAVPEKNIEFVVRTSNDESEADPTRDKVVRAFARMWKRCWTDNGAPRVGMGRRLYVYVSGHGLTGDLNHGVLLCSNSSDSLYATVGPHLTIQDFRKAGFFREFVIWFDGCMDATSLAAEPLNLQPRAGNDTASPGPVFAAYAARPRLRAIEAADTAGKMRGAFTRALLSGLGGAAAENGQIDSTSLKNYLYNALQDFLPFTAFTDDRVDKQPFVIEVNANAPIVFAAAQQPPPTPIVFQIGPQFDGAQAQIWAKGAQLNQGIIANGQVTFSLPKGLYYVVVPAHRLKQGFQVIGGVATKLPEAN